MTITRDDEKRANALLISAAPDLLEALRETTGALETILGSAELRNYHRLRCMGADILLDARVAIAKATGGAK